MEVVLIKPADFLKWSGISYSDIFEQNYKNGQLSMN